jgi:predicted flap endonuclease-1-like 5' DNA nuclease
MTETIMTHTIEVCLWLLVAFALGLLLGYIIWYKWRRIYLEMQREHERLSAQHRELEKEHKSLHYKYEELEKDFNKRRTRISALEGDVTVLTNKLKACEEAAAAGTTGRDAVMAAAAPIIEKDDLKKIEGIGPKIEQLCNNIGIYTWRQLANTSVETLQKMLDDAGPNYKISNPGTWPKQAEYAADGEWEKLQEYQDYLDGGVDPK